MLDVTFITAPRSQPTLAQTLDSYFTYFDPIVTVFAEPGTPILNQADILWHENPKRRGIFRNTLAALEAAYMRGADYTLFCEDDVEFTPNVGPWLRTWMRNNHPGKVGFVSAYCALPCASEVKMKTPGWYEPRLESSGWCGNLCMLFPWEGIDFLLNNMDDLAKLAVIDDTGVERAADYAIGELFRKHGWKMYAAMPTLVLHTGQVSTNEANNSPLALHNRPFNRARQPAL